MLIDCDTCLARPGACDDCVVGVLLGTPAVPARDATPDAEPPEPGGPLPVEFGPVERRALEVLADHGLIPRLRLITAEEPDAAQPTTRRRRDDRTRDVG